MKRIALLLAVLAAAGLHAAEHEVGLELQAYPTGVVSSVGVKRSIGDDAFLTFRTGYNRADRDDNGERGDERGGGSGVSAGYRKLFSDSGAGWFAGGRVDLWFLKIDWIDAPGTPGETRGRSDVRVLQPTGVAGYRKPFGKDRAWIVEPAVSLGVEWNVDTDGADVGQGPILLFGIGLSRRF